MKHLFPALLLIAVFAACSPAMLSRMNAKSMSQLELGMSKQQLIEVLGNYYTISEKRMQGEDEIEVLSYRNYPYEDEIYQFVFVNKSLIEWHRELVPTYDVKVD
ncbi:DUF3192 domain-containing protein [Algoriphagus sp. H41]|uniref:DUF3192 domain-containing protein n=1 Tax=Algoriphagus oliviformis TaxID=2811231 RepID=A0ABS3C1F6_9BACT|nr:DUF3192 domain-containing protein [Algoriphagus oliviformis]MBN7810950.1 DUF3192 domain-containing protein [Algoriphagus oliviformis]